MPEEQNKLKLCNCPSCKNWWFDRSTKGCLLNDNRVTYTTYQIGSMRASGIKLRACDDFTPKDN